MVASGRRSRSDEEWSCYDQLNLMDECRTQTRTLLQQNDHEIPYDQGMFDQVTSIVIAMPYCLYDKIFDILGTSLANQGTMSTTTSWENLIFTSRFLVCYLANTSE